MAPAAYDGVFGNDFVESARLSDPAAMPKAQATVGGELKPLILTTGTGEALLALTPELWSLPPIIPSGTKKPK